MKKVLLLTVFALSLIGSAVVRADPPAPVCPPFCDDPTGQFVR
jgi:hypothetical protein